jgi:MinD superfamily P-loop ATPase
MKIAVASGKGGTGKTTVACSFALSLAAEPMVGSASSTPPLFLDCDVEAPNAHLFLNPDFQMQQDAIILIPQVDETRCTYCRRCAQVCQYNAIAVLGQSVLIFPELCHGCGSCTRQCPEKAIREVPLRIGLLQAGPARGGIHFARGVLEVGHPMPAPVTRQLKSWAAPQADQLVLIDAPPGTSCPVVEAIRGADFLLLVTEPTPCGLHDLRLSLELAHALGLPAAVVINRDGIGDSRVEEFCRRQAIPVLLRIPFSKEAAYGIARGMTLIDIQPQLTSAFRGVYRRILQIMEPTKA